MHCLCLLLFLFVSVLSQSVAPDDANEKCLEMNKQSTPSAVNETVLLDTNNYNMTELLGNGGKWLSVNQTWQDKELNGARGEMNGECRHSLTTCHDSSLDNNWLITQYINISDSGVERLKINVTHSSCTSCGQQNTHNFSIWTYQTNEMDKSGRNNISLYQYSGINVTNTHTTTTNGVFPVSKSGLYLAIVDEGACTMIQRIVIYYSTCHDCVPHDTSETVYPEKATSISVASEASISANPSTITDSSSSTFITTLNPTSSNELSTSSVVKFALVGAGSAVTVVLVIVMVNILLCLLIVRKRRRSSLEGQTNKDYTRPTSYQSANLMSLSSYDPYQTQVSDDDEYQYDEQKGVDGVQTFTGEETREDAENKND